jgi:hypothetical protein
MAWTEIDFGVTAKTLDQSGRVRLGESDFEYRLLWNTRTEKWSISLSTVADPAVLVLQGRPLHIGVDVLARCNVTGRPPGTLFLWRNDNSWEPITHDELGAVARVWYTDPE